MARSGEPISPRYTRPGGKTKTGAKLMGNAPIRNSSTSSAPLAISHPSPTEGKEWNHGTPTREVLPTAKAMQNHKKTSVTFRGRSGHRSQHQSQKTMEWSRNFLRVKQKLV
jgi:hypothetical protein